MRSGECITPQVWCVVPNHPEHLPRPGCWPSSPPSYSHKFAGGLLSQPHIQRDTNKRARTLHCPAYLLPCAHSSACPAPMTDPRAASPHTVTSTHPPMQLQLGRRGVRRVGIRRRHAHDDLAVTRLARGIHYRAGLAVAAVAGEAGVHSAALQRGRCAGLRHPGGKLREAGATHRGMGAGQDGGLAGSTRGGEGRGAGGCRQVGDRDRVGEAGADGVPRRNTLARPAYKTRGRLRRA